MAVLSIIKYRRRNHRAVLPSIKEFHARALEIIDNVYYHYCYHSRHHYPRYHHHRPFR